MGKAKYEVGDVVDVVASKSFRFHTNCRRFKVMKVYTYPNDEEVYYSLMFLAGHKRGEYTAALWEEGQLLADDFANMVRRLQREERSRKSKKSRAARR